jgi:hypothetical protein
METGTPVLSPVSNAYENEFIQQRIGANIRTIKKKYNYTLGIVAQPFTQKGYSITKDSVYAGDGNYRLPGWHTISPVRAV